jgi:hypothetical protein
MSLFLSFMTAASFGDLCPLAREVLAGCEDQFNDEFIPMKHHAKQNSLMGTLDDCMQYGITSDRGFLLMLRYSMYDTEEDVDDHLEEMRSASDPAESVQSISVPTYSEPHRSVSEVSAPVDKDAIKEVLAEFFTPKSVSRTGRQAKNDPKNAKHRCSVCSLCMSSHGALYNHVKSSGHKKALLTQIPVMRRMMAENPSYQISLSYRSKAKEDKPVIKPGPEEKWLDAFERWVQDEYTNPVMDFGLREYKKTWCDKLGDYKHETRDIPIPV